MSDAVDTADPIAKKAHIWARDPFDWYVEPSWVSARLFAVERMTGGIDDPACGQGNIVINARAAGYAARGSDIVSRGLQCELERDFLGDDSFCFTWDNIVCNPPFRHADAFVRRALTLARGKVCMLLPVSWMNGFRRSAWLETTPLRRVWIITPRPSMPPGAVLQAGDKPGGGTVDFAWFVWLQGYDGAPEIRWLRRDA